MASPTKRKNLILDDPAELREVFRVAHSHRWPITYSVTTGQRVSSHTTELLKVEPTKGTLTVSSEMKYSGLQPSVPTGFRSQSGGIVIEFESQLLGGNNTLSDRLFSECRIRYPATIKFSQLRNAVRIDCNSMDEILVTLFTEQLRLQGKVQDISATGVKIRFSGNLSYQFKHSRIVTDCHMRLPDGTIVEARLKVLGFTYDQDQDISYIRCYFLAIKEDEEMKLEELMREALERIPQRIGGF